MEFDIISYLMGQSSSKGITTLSGKPEPSPSLGKNGDIYLQYDSLLPVNGFTKLYATNINYGNLGAKVAARLAINDESSHSTLQAGGWNANGMALYDIENVKGAYGGYSFGGPLYLSKMKLWLNRYSEQNITLYVTAQYLDSNNEWQDVETIDISPSMAYPSCITEVSLDSTIPMYGVRWIHKDDPKKSSNNNLTFAGMTVYAAGDGIVQKTFAKVDGAWQPLIGTSISDILGV